MVHHFVSADRVTWRYFWRRCYFVNRRKVGVFQRIGSAANLVAEREFVIHALTAQARRTVRELASGRFEAVRVLAAMLAGISLAGIGHIRGRIDQLARRPENRLMGSAAGARGHIVYLTSTFEPEIGGTVTQTSKQARELVARGYAVTVLTVRSRDELARQEQRGGVRILRFGHWQGRAGELRAMMQWGRWLARHRDNISIVQAVMHPEYLWCAAAAGLGSRAVMLWVTRGDADSTLGQADTLPGRLMAIARRAAVRRASHVVLTPVMRTEVARYTTNKPVVIPVSVDSDPLWCRHFV